MTEGKVDPDTLKIFKQAISTTDIPIFLDNPNLVPVSSQKEQEGYGNERGAQGFGSTGMRQYKQVVNLFVFLFTLL